MKNLKEIEEEIRYPEEAKISDWVSKGLRLSKIQIVYKHYSENPFKYGDGWWLQYAKRGQKSKAINLQIKELYDELTS